ncbi:hypothetical protein [Kineococcus sp. SYSU DK005]|uniref:hypothetical protein n=1 Tax=Kineococcus sp. SYSU DK005 TaxID=3383126 RepID=UPI003D7D4667
MPPPPLLLPRPVVDALLDFVEHRAQPAGQLAGQLGGQPLELEDVHARARWVQLAQRYRRAVREGRRRCAGRLERALLQVALEHREHPDFDRSWSHWHELLRAFER